MKILGDLFRNMFVIYSYFSAMMFGSVVSGDKLALHLLYTLSAATAISGILWSLTRLLYRRGYRLAIVWTKEAA